MVVLTEEVCELFRCVAEVMIDKSDELCEMDARVGDGDLGLTMKKGFSTLPDILKNSVEKDIGKQFIKAGMHMLSVVPSTMGTLMASGLLSGGKHIIGRSFLDTQGYLEFLKGFAEGIMKRGKCVKGERTVLDAIVMAEQWLSEELKRMPDLELAQAGEIAVQGAFEGVKATQYMVPKYGKAAVHKEAALKTVDPGACAGMYMLKGFCNYFKISNRKHH